MLRYYFITYAPSSDDNKLFITERRDRGYRLGMDTDSVLYRLADVNVGGGDPVCKVLQILQEVSEYFIFGQEHPTSNIHYHGAGKVKDSISYKDSDWLANKLRPFLPKQSSSKLATRISWLKPKPNESVESQSLRTLAYCQKEDKNAFKFNITPEIQTRLDTLNEEVPDRDPITYEFAKSERDYFCRVMRVIRGMPADHQRYIFTELAGDPRFCIWKVMQHEPVIYMGNFNRIADGIRQQMIKERIGVSNYEIEWRAHAPDLGSALPN